MPASRRCGRSACSIRPSRSRRWPRCRTARRSASAGAACCTRRPRRGSRAHRAGMVADGDDTLDRDYYRVEDQRGPPLLALSRRALRPGDGPARAGSARALRMNERRYPFAELGVTSNFSFLAGGSHAARTDRPGPCARPCRHRHRRPQHLLPASCARMRRSSEGRRHFRQCSAAPSCPSSSPSAPGSSSRDGTPDILAYPEDRAGYGAALPSAQPRQAAARRKASAISISAISSAMPRDLLLIVMPPSGCRRTAGAMLLAACANLAPGRGLARRDACTAAATTAAVSPGCGAWRQLPACRSSPSMTCSITRRTGARCRTCSPASARRRRSKRRAAGWRPMPSGI